MTKLNAGGDTVAGVDYTVIESTNDEVVTPYTSAFLSGPNVTNITLQSQCSQDQGEHLSMPYDHIADADVLTALDPAHPQRRAPLRIFGGGAHQQRLDRGHQAGLDDDRFRRGRVQAGAVLAGQPRLVFLVHGGSVAAGGARKRVLNSGPIASGSPPACSSSAWWSAGTIAVPSGST